MWIIKPFNYNVSSASVPVDTNYPALLAQGGINAIALLKRRIDMGRMRRSRVAAISVIGVITQEALRSK